MVVVDDGDTIRGLGFVTLYAAYLEEAIDECMEVLWATDKQHSTVDPSKWQASQKLKYCIQQAKGCDIGILTEGLEGSRGLLERRNDVVHGRIYAQAHGPEVRKSGRLGVRDREITSAELYKLANELHEHVLLLSHEASLYRLNTSYAPD